MTGYEIATLVISTVQALASVGAVTAILVGIRQMRQAGDQRAEREDQRHAEAMTSLRALVAGLEQQGEALREMGEALRQQGAALEAALKGRA